jgi:hypothetical protein
MDEVEWLVRQTDPKLLSLAESEVGINLVLDMAVSSAISWATDRRVKWSLMQDKLYEVPIFVAKYLPSRDFKEALALVMAALDRHCKSTKSLLIQAVVNKVCFFVNLNFYIALVCP